VSPGTSSASRWETMCPSTYSSVSLMVFLNPHQKCRRVFVSRSEKRDNVHISEKERKRVFFDECHLLPGFLSDILLSCNDPALDGRIYF